MPTRHRFGPEANLRQEGRKKKSPMVKRVGKLFSHSPVFRILLLREKIAAFRFEDSCTITKLPVSVWLGT